MQRKISPLSDLGALFRLCRLLVRIRPELVHTHTPKAGLLGMIAARITGVRVRIYTINGLVWITSSGYHRSLLMATERLACALATDIVAVSDSIRRVAVDLKICPADKIRVLGSGASHGVDLVRFDPAATRASGAALRIRLGIPPNALVLLFVGRLVRQKGVEELAAAWRHLREEFPESHLLLCGQTEERDAVSRETITDLRQCARVHFAHGLPADMPSFYDASDVCVLPTWREGLPNVALEVAAMSKPIVATRIPGCVDAIRDGITGLLVEPRDSEGLTKALRCLLSDEPLRASMGNNSRRFVADHFSERSVSLRLVAEYRRLLGLVAPPMT